MKDWPGAAWQRSLRAVSRDPQRALAAVRQRGDNGVRAAERRRPARAHDVPRPACRGSHALPRSGRAGQRRADRRVLPRAATFRSTIVSLWSDPRQGILKQGCASPNPRLRHVPLRGRDEDVRNLAGRRRGTRRRRRARPRRAVAAIALSACVRALTTAVTAAPTRGAVVRARIFALLRFSLLFWACMLLRAGRDQRPHVPALDRVRLRAGVRAVAHPGRAVLGRRTDTGAGLVPVGCARRVVGMVRRVARLVAASRVYEGGTRHRDRLGTGDRHHLLRRRAHGHGVPGADDDRRRDVCRLSRSARGPRGANERAPSTPRMRCRARTAASARSRRYLVLVIPLLPLLLAPRPVGFGAGPWPSSIMVAVFVLLLVAARLTENRMIWVALAAGFLRLGIARGMALARAARPRPAALGWRSCWCSWWCSPCCSSTPPAGARGPISSRIRPSRRRSPTIRASCSGSTRSSVSASGRGSVSDSASRSCRDELRDELRDPMLAHAHNLFVSQWLQTGAIGVATLLALLARAGVALLDVPARTRRHARGDRTRRARDARDVRREEPDRRFHDPPDQQGVLGAQRPAHRLRRARIAQAGSRRPAIRVR